MRVPGWHHGGDAMKAFFRTWTLLVVATVAVGIMSMACQKATIPIGAVISLIGAPFFAYLLISRGKEYST